MCNIFQIKSDRIFCDTSSSLSSSRLHFREFMSFVHLLVVVSCVLFLNVSFPREFSYFLLYFACYHGNPVTCVIYEPLKGPSALPEWILSISLFCASRRFYRLSSPLIACPHRFSPLFLT